MQAKFTSICPGCRKTLSKGDEIKKPKSNFVWHCVRCANFFDEAYANNVLSESGAPFLTITDSDAWHERQARELPKLLAKHELRRDDKGRLHDVNV